MSVWRVVGASVPGTLHLETGRGCDDAHGWLVDEKLSVVVVADGAGSRPGTSVIGSHAAVRAVLAAVQEEDFAARYSHNPDAAAHGLMDQAALEVSQTADSRGVSASALATTLCVAVLDEARVTIIQIGDGIAVVERADGTPQHVAVPDEYEYANQTVFLTRPDFRTHLKLFSASASEIRGLTLSSDGLRYKMLDLSSRSPFERFFEQSWASARSADMSSFAIEEFLVKVEDQTGDDLTLVIAVSGYEGEPGERMCQPEPAQWPEKDAAPVERQPPERGDQPERPNFLPPPPPPRDATPVPSRVAVSQQLDHRLPRPASPPPAADDPATQRDPSSDPDRQGRPTAPAEVRSPGAPTDPAPRTPDDAPRRPIAVLTAAPPGVNGASSATSLPKPRPTSSAFLRSSLPYRTRLLGFSFACLGLVAVVAFVALNGSSSKMRRAQDATMTTANRAPSAAMTLKGVTSSTRLVPLPASDLRALTVLISHAVGTTTTFASAGPYGTRDLAPLRLAGIQLVSVLNPSGTHTAVLLTTQQFAAGRRYHRRLNVSQTAHGHRSVQDVTFAIGEPPDLSATERSHELKIASTSPAPIAFALYRSRAARAPAVAKGILGVTATIPLPSSPSVRLLCAYQRAVGNDAAILRCFPLGHDQVSRVGQAP